jgi:tetratricopeptide (TPR) repeat protein
MPLYVMVRFGMWDEVFAAPEPPADRPYLRGVWHYARGMAQLSAGQTGKARKELGSLERLAADPAAAATGIGYSNASMLLEIAGEILGGELAAKQGRTAEGLMSLERAVRLADGMAYNEPPDWYYPVRHTLGAVLLELGRPAQAETVYWQDLRKNRENGYALFGLWQSLAAQDRHDEAAAIERRFRAAWSAADVQLSSSRF